VWEDEHLSIVDKPPGVVVHPAPGHRSVTLVEWLEARAGGAWRPHVVHRLDRDTSGLLLVAKTEPVQRRLRELLRRRLIEREYLALVHGRPASLEGVIDAPIGRDVRRRTRMSTDTDKPRDARTHFAVERFVGPFTLLRARLDTGRTHQIRAHLAAIGTPVCGDRDYGGGGPLGLERQFLHSSRLAFPHPVSGEAVEHRSSLPPDLAAALSRAEAEQGSR
jgi:23S rRNA pseudouridine1911/1915/1917 synthase